MALATACLSAQWLKKLPFATPALATSSLIGVAPIGRSTMSSKPAAINAARVRAARFPALGLRAATLADQETLTAAEGFAVAAPGEPGGGHIVCLTDPDGFGVEVVAEQEAAPLLPDLARNGRLARTPARSISCSTSGNWSDIFRPA